MKNLIGVLFKVYAAGAAYLVALFALLAGILFYSGAITLERVQAALVVLRTPKPQTPESLGAQTEEERRALERTQRQREETLEQKEKGLGALDALAAAQLGQIRKEREDLDGTRKQLESERQAVKVEREALAAAKMDAEMAANVPIFSKMDGAMIVQAMKAWDNATIVRYLRALKPAKAVEVIEAVRNDPQFEQEFRQVPPGGGRARAELLMEEFKKAP